MRHTNHKHFYIPELMAEERVEIIRIEFDASEAIKNTKTLREERDKLIKLGKELEQTEGKNSEAVLKNAAQVKVLNDSIREQEKVTQNLIKANQEAAGSNQQLKAQLSVATSELNRLSEVERTTTQRGRELTATVLDLTNKLKANESAVGNNFRNVGNYREALAGLGGPLGNAARGIQGFNTTLKANPVLAVVGVINVLSAAFSKLQPVIDATERAFGALGQTFDVLIQRGKLLLQGDFIGAFTGIGSALNEAALAGAEYVRVQQEIEDAQRLQNITNAEAEKQIAVLTVQLKDKTKTDQERLAIADQITQIEQKNFEANKVILQQTLQNEEQKLRALLREQGVKTELLKTTKELVQAGFDRQIEDESINKVVAAQVALTNAEKESAALSERVQLRRNAILEQAEEQRKKEAERAAERRKKEQEEIKKYNENLLKLQDEFGLSERQKIEKGFDDKIKTLRATGEREIALRQQIEAAKAEALAKFDAELLDKEKDLADKRELALLAIQEDNVQTRLKIFEIQFRKEAAELTKQGNTAVQIEQIKQARINEIVAQGRAEDFSKLQEALAREQELRLTALEAAELTEEEKARRRLEINLQTLQAQLAATQAFAQQDAILTQEELDKLDLLRLKIAAIKTELERPVRQTLAQSLGVDPVGLAKIDEGLGFIQAQLTAIVQQINDRAAVELQNIENVNEQEIAAIEQSTLSEEEKKQKIDALNKDTARKKYEIEKNAFEQNKAFSIVQTVISGAQAVVKALAELGPIAGAIASAVIIGTTAAQITTITSQKPPPPPKFASGVVGLDGAGNETSDSIPAYLSRGESVITAKGTRFAQANYPGFLEFLNSKNKFADGVVNFNSGVVPSSVPNVGEQVRAALSGLQIVTKVTDVEKAMSDRNSVRTVGVI